MLKHGGRFENYFSKHTVTHIICGNLPDSKMRNLRCEQVFLVNFASSVLICSLLSIVFGLFWLRAFSHGLPVVRPQWVLDCLAANRLLNCEFSPHAF